MAKIRYRTPKNVSGGYERIFGIPELGTLMSKVQSAVISSGNELEKLIQDRVEAIEDLDDFLSRDTMPEGIFLATKKEIKRCSHLYINDKNPHSIIFKRQGDQHRCHIIELKDGHVFDTKKVLGEVETLHRFVERNAETLRHSISTHFCAFNQEDRQAVWDGFKRGIDWDEAITGREFCNLLEIDYDEIVNERLQDTEDNTLYFVQELLSIPEIRSLISDVQTNNPLYKI